jgi:endonuclease/exonuclease/phosphatase family metal-dependent hydrolase
LGRATQPTVASPGVYLKEAVAPPCKLLLIGLGAFAISGACAPLRVASVSGILPRCVESTDTRVTWDRPAAGQLDLDAWCAGVGPPVVAPGSLPSQAQITRLVVASWNVHVDDVATLVKMRHDGGTGLVLLLQEAFRSGAAVGTAPRGVPVPRAIRPNRPVDDIVQLAARLGLSAFYVPSMRNGASEDPGEREDRGSAILSTEPLSDLAAIELPMARQRRVAVMATVTPRHPAATPLRVVSTHFDVVVFGGGAVRQAQHLAQRIPALNAGLLPVVIGADANATRGFAHGTVTALAAVAPVLRQCGTGRTSAWIARSDFIFTDLPEEAIARCKTLEDRYGSDHRPIVLTIAYPMQ